jgi:tape measure domain-containing protein
MSGILIDVNTKTEKAQKDLESIKRSVANIQTSTDRATTSILNFAKGLGAIVASGAVLTFLSRASTQLVDMGNKVALVTGRTNDLVYAQGKLLDITERTRGSLDSSVLAFSTFGKSLKTVGVSTDQLLKATETLQQAVAISGSSAESANAAIIQLGQGIASGVLRGEELNSVMEQTPRIAQAIADSMNLNIGQLRKAAEEGRLTSTTVFQGILSQAGVINKEFSQIQPTLRQSTTVLSQAVSEFVSELDTGLNLSNSLGAAILSIAGKIRVASRYIAADAFLFASNFREGVALVMGVVTPLISIFASLGEQLIMAFPQAYFTRTVAGDFKEGLRVIDDAAGGTFTKLARMFQYGIPDLLDYDSDVEKAVKQLKRLSPQAWLTGGFDTQTMKRFFSTTTLKLYGDAFADLAAAIKANSTTMWATFGNLSRAAGYELQDVLRYIGALQDTLVTFRIGNLDNLLYSVTELIRGLTGVQLKFTQFWRLVEEVSGPTVVRLKLAIEDVFANVPKAMISAIDTTVSILSKLAKGSVQILKDIFKVDLPSIKLPDLNANAFKRTLTDIVSSVKENLQIAAEHVRKFSREVIHYFFTIYDEVIAHSWWTDTMNGVVDQSAGLYDRVRQPFERFYNYVSSIFTKIADNKEIFGIKFNFSFKAGDYQTVIADVKDRLVESFKTASHDFLTIFRTVASLIGGILALAFIPSGKVKLLISAFLFESFIEGALVLSDRFSAIFGANFSEDLGKAFGNISAVFTASFIRDIPELAKSLLSLASGFTSSFLKEIPVIGTAIKGLFNLTDATGTSGIVGTILFGAGATFIAANFKTIMTNLAHPFDFLKGVLSGSKGGYLVEGLFGLLGPTRFISILGLVANALGIFDGIFAESKLVQYAAAGGLAYLAFAGKDGLDKIAALFATKVVNPIRSMIATQFSGAGGGAISGMILGDGNSFKTVALGVVTKYVGNAGDFILEKAKLYGKKAIDFTTLLLFGTQEGLTLNLIKEKFGVLFNAVVSQVTKIRLFLAKSDLLNNLFNLDGTKTNSLAAKFGDIVNSIFSKFKPKQLNLDFSAVKPVNIQSAFDFGGIEASANKTITRVTATASTANAVAAAVGGDTGIVGKAFFGRYGSAIVVGLALLAFAGIASAATNSAASVKTSSYSFDDFLNTLNRFKTENPLGFWAITLATVSVPIIIAAVYQARSAILSLIASTAVAAVTSPLASLGNLVTGIYSKAGFATKALIGLGGAAAAAFGIAQVAGLSALDTISIFAGLAGIVYAAWAPLSALFGLIFKGIVGAVGTASAAIGLLTGGAALIAGGILGVLFFGNGNTFLEKFDDIYTRAKELVGLGTGISAGAERFDKLIPKENRIVGKDANIEIKLDFNKIDFKQLDEKFTNSFKKVAEKFNEALAKGAEEKFSTGTLSEATKGEIQEAYRQLERVTARAEAKSKFDIEKATGDINKYAQAQQTWLSKIINAPKQLGLDAALRMEESINAVNQSTGQFGVGPGVNSAFLAKRQLEARKREGDFNAFQVYANEDTKKIQSILNRIPRKSEIQQGVREEDIGLDKQFAPAVQRFVTALQNNAQAMRSWSLVSSETIAKYRAQLESAAADVVYFGDKLAAMQFREDQVRAFNTQLGLVGSKLKEAGVSIDDNVLFSSDERSWKGITALTKNINDLWKAMKETSGASGATGFTERLDMVLKQRINIAKVTLDANQAAEKNLLPPAEAAFAAASRTDFSLKDQVRRVSGDAAVMVRNEIQDIERLLVAAQNGNFGTKYFKDLFPPDVPKEVTESFDKFEAYIKERKRQLEAIVMENVNAAAGSQALGQITGIDTSGRALLGMSPDMIRRRDADIERMYQLQNQESDAFAKGDVKAWRAAGIAIEDLRKKMEAQAPVFKTFSDTLSQLGTFGAQINFEDWYKYDPTKLKELVRITEDLAEMQRRMGLYGSRNIPLAQRLKQSELLDKQKEYLSQEAFRNKLYSIDDKNQEIQAAGNTLSLRDRIWMSEDDFNSMIREANVYADIKRVLSNPDTYNKLLKSGTLQETLDSQAEIVQNAIERSARNRRLSFTEQIQDISSAGITLDINKFLRIDPVIFGQYRNLAQQIYVLGVQLNNKDLSPEERLRKAIELRSKQFEAFKANLDVEGYTEKLSAIQNVFTDVNVSANEFAALAPEARENLAKLADTFRIADEELKRIGVGGRSSAAGIAAAKARRDAENQARQIIDPVRPFGAAIVDKFKLAGVSIEAASANLLDKVTLDGIQPMVDQMKDLKLKLDTPGENLDEAARVATQRSYDELNRKLAEKLRVATLKPQETQAFQAGVNFAGNVKRSFVSGLTDLLTGKASAGDVFKTMFTSLAENVANTFAEGLASAMFKQGGPLDELFKSVGSLIFEDGANTFKGLFGGNSEISIQTAATERLTLAIYQLIASVNGQIAASTYSTSFGGLGGLFSSAFPGASVAGFEDILGFGLYANGGSVVGPGTGLSDSIPAMLSNGEFVVNARSAAKYRPLLEMLNTSQGIRKYANGGIVMNGFGSVNNIPMEVSPNRKQEKGDSIFNINITGDVSRQTRMEVQKMIPQIATGVNMHNKEQGRAK